MRENVSSPGTRESGLLVPHRLPPAFYHRSTAEVARDLLGHLLVHAHPVEGLAAGRIVEAEAYLGVEDAASHAHGRRTPRNGIMFDEPGHAYVYFIYGNHFCFNAVAHADGPGAVLIRAVEPVVGVELMARRRGLPPEARGISNGPGKLARALAIDRGHTGLALFDTKSPLWIARGDSPPTRIVVGPRVGIRQASHLHLRFYDADSACVSQR